VAGGIALGMVVVVIVLIRMVWKALRGLFRGAEQAFAS
jgi:hypothetical protein